MERLFIPSPLVMGELTHTASSFVRRLHLALRQHKVPAQVFIGGSFAKGTLVPKNVYDIDIFVRVSECTPAFSETLHEILRTLETNVNRVHGSRDYFQVSSSPSLVFDVVPVKKITRPEQMENVTDLSYFHVAYVTKRLTRARAHEVVLAKLFCQSGGFYGAESYINGFSGYCLECLIIHYGSFVRMLRALVTVREQVILDPARHYRSEGELFREVSEAKRKGPLLLVDPTWPARNVAAGLSQECFTRFQERAQAYLQKPHTSFFEETPFREGALYEEARAKKGCVLKVSLETNAPKGDVAGTKLKKMHTFLAFLLIKRFTLVKETFHYTDGQTSTSYFILRNKQVVQQGPLLSMTKHALAFKKAHPKARVKKGRYLYTLPTITAETYLKENVSIQTRQGMGITRLTI